MREGDRKTQTNEEIQKDRDTKTGRETQTEADKQLREAEIEGDRL